MRGVLGVVISELRIITIWVGGLHVSDNVDEGNPQHTSNVGQDGLHLFKSLGGRGEAKGNGGIIRLLVIGSPSVFESLLLLEQVEGLKVDPHKRIRGPTDLTSGASMVPDPEGQEFKSGHSQLSNW